jgi:hypothetical protein
MDRKLSRKNIRFGVSLFILMLALIGISFAWAAIYLQVIK